jgi:hypothetical protein
VLARLLGLRREPLARAAAGRLAAATDDRLRVASPLRRLLTRDTRAHRGRCHGAGFFVPIPVPPGDGHGQAGPAQPPAEVVAEESAGPAAR